VQWHTTPLTVRFNEVDAYRVAWHGHYVAWMEVGRNDLAGRFGLDAEQIGALGFRAPVISLDLQFKRPARFNESLVIGTAVQRAETATLEFLCRISGGDGKVIATGRTVHVLTDDQGVLLYQLPAVIAERLGRMLAALEEE
jgi:acyl-CoA thioester hydrolase